MIFALSSGPPPSGVAIIRLSGHGVFDAVRLLTGTRRLPTPRTAMLRSIVHPRTQQLIDKALVLIFPGPESFTGEDMAELHCHGSPAVIAAVQQACLAAGLRPAEPGEFTARAFRHGKLDLTQAEALADLIAAETEAQREQALANAGGRLRDQADQWRETLIGLMADIEADLDFADEADVATSRARPAIAALATAVRAALQAAPIGERVRHGLAIAIAGPPNAGKSSLLNALARREVAIVTPTPGTTRDIIEVHLDLAGRPATLLDTAGLRETGDPVEAEGIARARARAGAADLVLNLGPDPIAAKQSLRIVNRIDETGEAPGLHHGALYLSARTGAGIPELEQWLADWAAQAIPTGEPPLVTTARQAHLLRETLHELESAAPHTDPLLAAEHLRAAAHALGRLTGRIDPEAVLGAIFSRFCIGK
jgi:tRNA modification GTPase